MRENFWQFFPTHTAFLSTNHRPEVKGTDHAIWRRIKLVPFEVTIPEAEQDKKLAAKLRAELPGILSWIVRGCLEWQRYGLGESEEVKAATTSYRDDMDNLAGFIQDRCVVDPRASVGATPLYKEDSATRRGGPLSDKEEAEVDALVGEGVGQDEARTRVRRFGVEEDFG
jgi:putative DNA primase/helicase